MTSTRNMADAKATPVLEEKTQLNGRVAVMPKNYLPARKKGLPMNKLLIILAVIVLAAIIVGMIVFFILSARSTPTPPPVQTPVVTPDVVEEVEEPTQPEPVVEEEPEEEPEQEGTQENGFILPELSLVPLQISTDTDKDGLTDAEELVFATSAAVPDTDQDSFLDGQEVVNLYDPATAGALLEVSPQIKIARNDSQNYQFLMPLDWTATKNTPRGEEMIIRPDTGTETMRISIVENPERLSASEWYQQNASVVDFTQLKNFSNEAGWVGIQSQDGTLTIATFRDEGPGARAFIFVMHYDPGTAQTIQYPSLWQMILQSMAVFEPDDIES